MNFFIIFAAIFLILYKTEQNYCFKTGSVYHRNKIRTFVPPEIQERMFEVTITTQIDIKFKAHLFQLKDKCKGVIINLSIIMCTARCMDTDFQKYRVYSGYLDVNITEGLQIQEILLVVRHPKYNKKNKTYDIAIIQVKEKYDFGNQHCAAGLLPDRPLNLKSGIDQSMKCSLMGFQPVENGTYSVEAVKLELLSNEECSDRIKVLNLNLDINRNQSCVIGKNDALLGPEIFSEGTAVLCGKYIYGILPYENYNDWKNEYPVPITDIGNLTTWLRKQLIQLRSGCYTLNINRIFTVILLFFYSIFSV